MPTIKVPESLCLLVAPAFSDSPDSPDITRKIRNATKTMIEAAIRDALPPAQLPAATESGLALNLSFAAREDKAIRALAKSLGIRDGDAALMYLYAAVARGDASDARQEKLDFLARYRAALLHAEPRHHQNLFAEYVLDSLNSNQVGLVEGATGVGKTIAMIAACAELLRGKAFGRCVVAVPTIQLLEQFALQHQAFDRAVLDDFPSGRFIVGRAEFVCVSELDALLKAGTEMIDPAPIRDWLAAGGPPLGRGEALGSHYLLSSLRAVSPLFPVEAVRLGIDSDADDPGAVAYAAQFARDNEDCREIIYCTHAMLAADLRRRMQVVRRTEEGIEIASGHQTAISAKILIQSALDGRTERDAVVARKAAGKSIHDLIQAQLEDLTELASRLDVGLLPPWQHILIDEAHAFESNLANTLSANVSLGRYVRNLSQLAEQGVITKAAHGRALSALITIRSKGDRDEMDLGENSSLAREFRSALQEMSNAFLESKKTKRITNALVGITRLQARTINLGLKTAVESRGGRAILAYSPVRAFPQLNVGQQTVRPQLAFLWQTAISGTCVSATLYLRKLDKDSAGYMAGVLNIPPSRVREYPTVRPAWTHAPVNGLWTPEAVKVDGQFWLRPPSRRDRLTTEQYAESERRWLDDVAKVLAQIYESAAGGVLVLLGSYAAADGLAERLPSIEDKVTASSKYSIHEQMRRFVDYGLAGRKALWLAVGGAWTGIDINGKDYGIADPTKDNLMTDLVVPRFPFGLNRSMTHRARVEIQSSIPWELLDATMRFKQGLGRLIRRPGLPPNRRIFVLDGRCNDPLFENYLSHLWRIMGVYPSQLLERK